MFDEYRQANLILRRKSGRIHLTGVAGVGMAGLASLLHWNGFDVSGCDLKENDLTGWLRDLGVKVYHGHSPEHIGRGFDAVIRSTAVSPDTPELECARRLSIPVLRRGIALAAVVNSQRSIAVSGTHGKTTTVAMMAQALRDSGVDAGFFLGAISDRLQGVAGEGGDVFIAEGDESDGTLRWYEPSFAVLTNADVDHLEHYEGEKDLWSCFHQFAAQAREGVIYNGDDRRAREICDQIPNAIDFGFSDGCAVRGSGFRQSPGACRFDLYIGDKLETRIDLPVSGLHNAYNALAVAGVARALGTEIDKLGKALQKYQSPRRRFEFVGKYKGADVYQDYSHHPTEIRSLLQSLACYNYRRILAVFQPHRYTRTLALGPQFPSAFDGVAHLVLVPVFAASEHPLKGGTSRDLYAHFREYGEIEVDLAGTLEEAWQHLDKEVTAEDVLLIIGAGDIEEMAKSTLKQFWG